MQRVIAYFVALVVSVVALAFGIRLAADNSSAFDRFKDGTIPTTTSTTLPGPRPAPGQAVVKGTITKLTAEGAQGAPLATPFTLAAVERGVGKATIENALVDGKRTSIAWGGGTPLPITGTDGSIDVSGSKVDVDASGATWAVDGATRSLKPGAYRAGAPVAVGVGGLATSRDAVAFTADAMTRVNTTGGVVIKVAAGKLDLKGPGKVTATGQLQIRDETSVKPAAGFQFAGGPYTVVVVPADGHLDLDAVLQGPLTRS
jgi:hypothetical protein